MSDESLRERARRVLMDNPEPPVPQRESPAADTAAGADEVELRLQAIRMVRDLGPKRACYSDRVRDLSLNLVETTGDSIHFRAVLDRLREAHEEWLRLEEKLWAANYVIRSTQWLIDLLADPGTAADTEVTVAHSDVRVAD